ncbi:MAG: VOC family protein [Bryobacteraceae bacterium]
MKSVNTYLHFDGNCREAMSFYHKCLGGDLHLGAYPDANGKPSTDPNARIMHSQLSRGGAPILMASDGTPGGSWKLGNNFSASVECDSLEEIERLFAAVGQSGQIILPLGEVPWGARFGMLTDRFGVQWMFNFAEGK